MFVDISNINGYIGLIDEFNILWTLLPVEKHVVAGHGLYQYSFVISFSWIAKLNTEKLFIFIDTLVNTICAGNYCATFIQASVVIHTASMTKRDKRVDKLHFVATNAATSQHVFAQYCFRRQRQRERTNKKSQVKQTINLIVINYVQLV